MEEAHEAVYCLYNLAERTPKSSKFLVSFVGAPLYKLLHFNPGETDAKYHPLRWLCPLGCAANTQSTVLLLKVDSIWVPFRPRAVSTETAAGLSSSPHSFSSFLLQEQNLITISTGTCLVLCVEGFRFKTGQENYIVDTVNTRGLVGFLVLLQPLTICKPRS